MHNIRQTRIQGARPPNPERRKTVVIADDGGEANLVILDSTHPTHAGSHFNHGGRIWVIRGQRHHSRILVAEPLVGPRQ